MYRIINYVTTAFFYTKNEGKKTKKGKKIHKTCTPCEGTCFVTPNESGYYSKHTF